MKNMMKEYLGEKYSEDYARNFCQYWIKYYKDEEQRKLPREKKDLDCLYFNGDSCADTLMSVWTPMKWVIKCIKKAEKIGKKEDMAEVIVANIEEYFPPENELVKLFYEFLKLAEQRCNYILLPVRKINGICMNPERYNRTHDQVPATLAHIYKKESLGQFFLGKDGEVDIEKVQTWVVREHLEMGYYENKYTDSTQIIPIIQGTPPENFITPNTESEVSEALQYMITFLEKRKAVLSLEE